MHFTTVVYYFRSEFSIVVPKIAREIKYLKGSSQRSDYHFEINLGIRPPQDVDVLSILDFQVPISFRSETPALYLDEN